MRTSGTQSEPGDGRIIDQAFPAEEGCRDAAGPGGPVWYDSADPSDVLVYGRNGRRSDTLFIAAGIGLIIDGAAIAGFGS